MNARELISQFKSQYHILVEEGCFVLEFKGGDRKAIEHELSISYKQGFFLLSLLRQLSIKVGCEACAPSSKYGKCYYFVLDSISYELISPPEWFKDKGRFKLQWSTFKNI